MPSCAMPILILLVCSCSALHFSARIDSIEEIWTKTQYL